MPQVEIRDLFPTPFLHARSWLPEAQVTELRQAFHNMAGERNAKSPGLMHTAVLSPEDYPAYEKLCQALLPLLSKFGSLLFGQELPWKIKELWMNALAPSAQQSLHSHANSFISGVVYLSECHPSARTVFYRGMGGRDFTFGNDGPDVKQGPYNSPRWAVPPVGPGDLVLFPSYLLHEVPPNQGDLRYTLAFNAIPGRLRSWGYEVKFE